MTGSSISRLIILIQSATLACFAAIVIVVAVLAWDASRQASDVVSATRTDQALFDAVIDVRGQIAKTLTAIIAENDPRSTIATHRDKAGATYETTIALLRDAPIAGRDTLIDGLEAAWGDMSAQQRLVDAQARLSLTDRDLDTVKPWSRSVRAVVQALNDTSEVVGNQVRLNDPFVAEMIQVRRLAWRVRDRFGSQCATLRRSVAKSRPLTPEVNAKWHDRIGSYQTAWSVIDTLLSRSGAPSTVVNAASQAQAATIAVQERLVALVAGFDDSGKPAMPAAEYTAFCNEPFGKIVNVAFAAMDEAVALAEKRKGDADIVLAAACAALLFALAMPVFTIRSVLNRFSRPIGKLMTAVGGLANREFGEPVPQMPRDDELGRLASALEELRKSALRSEELQQERLRAQQEQIARGDRLSSAVAAFETVIFGVVSAVNNASGHMQENSVSLSSIAEETTTRTRIVASASNEASTNVQIVASASEQLSASIKEVNVQISSSSDMANEAVGEVNRTTQSFEELKKAAQNIDAVVELIQNIASQTNLLALNATIESARAGEAGRGFAVVANEVKKLATQTHTATEDIARQIGGIQSAVGGCVEAIAIIGESIRKIDQSVSAIAVATDEQSEATQEIARNVQQAATGTTEVSENITSVTDMAGRTGDMSVEVLEASSDLNAQAESLSKEVNKFLADVRAI